jgi:competence protein ComEA
MLMNIAKLYKVVARTLGVVGLASAMALPMQSVAAEKSNVEPKAQVAEARTKEVGAKEQTAVNINTADAPALAAALNGVGIKKAEAIVAYREQNGKFTSAEQLLEVKGIGKATLDKNIDRIKI